MSITIVNGKYIMKFKVGDIVQFIKGGALYRVIEYNPTINSGTVQSLLSQEQYHIEEMDVFYKLDPLVLLGIIRDKSIIQTTQEILLQSRILTIVKVLKTTKAEFFKDLSIDSQILLTLPIKSSIRNGKYLNATYITITNLHTNATTYKSLTQLTNILEDFEFKEE